MIEIIEDRDHWNKLIETCRVSDFYHTYDYHQIDKKKGEKAILIHYRDDKLGVLFPLILRKIEGTGHFDATSVTGYPGPLVATFRQDAALNAFREELNYYFNELKLVSVFSRLNPFIPFQEEMLEGMGETVSPGNVVNIALTSSPDEQLRQYHRRLRTYINKSRREYHIKVARSEDDIREFIRLYHENMRRVQAMPNYFFDDAYFFKLSESSSFKTELLLAIANDSGEVVAGAMFIKKKGIIQYHLSGARAEYLKLNPIKMLIDEMRQQGTAEGYTYFNLGGGVANREDSLFEFKRSFSHDIRPFKVWRYIADQEVYDTLVREKGHAFCALARKKCPEYFPCYRCPNVK